MTEQEKIDSAVVALAAFIKNQHKKILKGQETYSKTEVDALWSKLEKVAEDVAKCAAKIERQRRIAEEAKKRERMEELDRKLQAVLESPAPAYNLRCRYHVQEVDRKTGTVCGHRCDVDYPLEHCGRDCPYATNMPGRTRPFDAPYQRKF